ncbi:class I SAM-dependent methyltransferase [soil metagenome]
MTGSLAPTPEADDALLALLARLKAADYFFVTPTPATHVLVRERAPASDADLLRDVFGWVRPFQAGQMPNDVLDLMRRAGLLVEEDGALKSAMRVSSLEGLLFLHSAPTRAHDAVFLGPDSYRFSRLLRQVLGAAPGFGCALDIGTGAGVGALQLQALAPGAEVHGSDINPAALRLAGLNARHAGLPIRTVLASGLPAAPRTFDVIVANPPYIGGEVVKTYRDGGEDYGAALGLDWVRASVGRLSPGGRFILYTGAAVVRGRDVVRDALTVLCAEQNLKLDYEEIDPDVFGRTLRQSAYRDVERIAAVGAVLTEA